MAPAGPGNGQGEAASGVYRSARGELFFGGPEGYNSFLPENLRSNAIPPPVVLTGFYKFNRPVVDRGPAYGLKSLRLGYRENVVSFDFAALDYAAPERNRYAYRLEGFSDQRIDLGSERRVTLTNLDAGRYVLRVMAANSDGVWNEKGVGLPIEVDPAPWRSPWAYALYGLALAAALAGFLRSQQQKLARETQYRQRLEVEVQQRTEELAQQNAKLEELNARLVESALTDSLTGMRNRRYFFEEISKEMSVVRRLNHDHAGVPGAEQQRLLFIMIDLDWFKAVNDTWGHAAGDRVLVQMKPVIEKACRLSDVVIRWGGDEFLVVARAVDLIGIEVVPERIRTTLEATPFDVGDGLVARLTCSVGFSCYPGTGPGLLDVSLEQVVALADRALYMAKHKGRNAWVGLLNRSVMSAEETARWAGAEPEDLIESGHFDVLLSPRSENDLGTTKPS